jgi:rubrerythrin
MDVESVVILIPVLFIVMFFLIVALVLRYNAKSEERQHELEMAKAKIAMEQQDATAAATKTIVKEVAMIPCKYCGTLIPETASSCPNCGAKRQA